MIPGRKSGTHLRKLDDAWQSVRSRAALHDVRHSFASRVLALGEGFTVIGKLLGHARIETTSRYAHLTRDLVRESAERVAASIAEDLL